MYSRLIICLILIGYIINGCKGDQEKKGITIDYGDTNKAEAGPDIGPDEARNKDEKSTNGDSSGPGEFIPSECGDHISKAECDTLNELNKVRKEGGCKELAQNDAIFEIMDDYIKWYCTQRKEKESSLPNEYWERTREAVNNKKGKMDWFLGYRTKSPQRMVSWWMEGEEKEKYRALILDCDYNQIGIGVWETKTERCPEPFYFSVFLVQVLKEEEN
jgi:hypothetical protein